MHFSALVIPFVASGAYAQLNTLAKAAGLKYFGTATDNVELTDTALVAALSNSSEWGQITPGNTQKWDSIEPSPNTFSFTKGDVISALAQKNSQLLRCHNLVWFQQLPAWVTGGTWTNATLTAALKNHVTNEVTHYKGQCYSWDVVNEALEANGTFRNSVFFRIIGESYIKIAFDAAAAADPDVKLYYNDFSIENPSKKTTAALNIVKSLKASGTKIDGVGLQSHFIVGSTPSKAVQIANLESFTALGVEVAITELDVRMQLPSTAAASTQQSTDYQNTVEACVAVKNCVGVTVWDFDDKYSWVPSTFPGTGSACLFDENLNRKPAYFGVVAALTGTKGNASISTATATEGFTYQPKADFYLGYGLVGLFNVFAFHGCFPIVVI
ncbi:glycoside hydrolase superfamily [Tricladium varicosporioides]|nr:glycoside hydrolase superfamily [Hymenoscyphus varicosporioides]